MPEISIQTRVGQYKVAFDTDEELQDELAKLKDRVEAVEKATRTFRPRAKRDPKPGLEATYGFTPEGQVELFHYPAEGIRCVVLALYAYHPEMVNASEVESVTGIQDVYSKVLRQTNNKKYFRSQDDLFGLSQDGVKYFSETVLQSLPSPAPLESGDDDQ